ncbi:MAG: alpha/beta hydrolase [Polyangiales bacterium]
MSTMPGARRDSSSANGAPTAVVQERRLTGSAPRLAYRVFGAQGDPVLFIMGFGMPGAVWGPQVSALKNDYRCCHYDHLGVGDSEPGSMFPTVEGMARDAVRVLDDLGWERVHVVGVSMGGMIAQELALHAPERCQSLTLVATHGGAPGAFLPTPEGLWHFTRGIVGGPKGRMRSLPKLLYPPSYLDRVDHKVFAAHMGTRLGKPAVPRTVFGQLLAIWRYRTEARLPQIQAPTLLVRPGLDILIRPRQTDRLAVRIPHAAVVRFEDAGHGVTFQKANELNAALREHFQRSK